MQPPPEGYVILPTSVSHKHILQELHKWKTALPSTPNQDGKFYIYVTEEEWATYIGELSYSTR
jgi:hypothetical protein